MTSKILNKENFFSYPTTVKAITEGRTRIEHLGRDLVDVIATAEDAAVITGERIIPYSKRMKEGYRHAQNFLKRGEEVYIPVPARQEEALRLQVGPGRRRLRAFEGVKPDERKCGYVWRSMRDGVRRKVHLVDCIEGAKIFAFSHQTGISDSVLAVKKYTHVGNVQEAGGAYDCRAPSRSRDLQFSFVLHSVPLLGTKEQHYVWTNLHSSGHGGGVVGKNLDTRCGSKQYDKLTFRSVVGEHVFCPHEIAAYLEISRKAGKDGQGKIMLQPFALPTPATVEFYKRCRNQVLLREIKRGPLGKERKTHRPLNEAELEVLLWRFTARQGYVDSWYASESRHGQRLRDYHWN
ncbi:MAG TPA: hypothetical protein VJH37_02820 [Candidatus Nanoarchaeia archaeon]|nr:hypothetical protein [Candidatus Nanoarchaeia archaeon]